MRLLIAVAVIFGLLLPLDARECLNGSSNIMSVTGWTAENYQSAMGPGISLTMTIENHTDHDLRMLDGRVYFDDILGRGITNLVLDEDARISARSTFQQSGRYHSFGTGDITRLAIADPSDIVATTCVVAAVTGSGEVLRHDSLSGAIEFNQSDIDALRLAVEECWNVGILSSEALQVVVTIGFEMSYDARPITGTIHLVDAQGGSQAAQLTAFEAGRRAIEQCGINGYGLPPSAHEQWRSMTITLDPTRMRSR